MYYFKLKILVKSGYLETKAWHGYGKVEYRNGIPDFEVVTPRDVRIAYFGFIAIVVLIGVYYLF